MTELLKIAIQAALEAGESILTIYNSDDFSVETKADQSPLTRADLSSNDIICQYLQNTGIPILSEEGQKLNYELRKDYKRLWIVDPLDGTKEFIKRNGEFTVNIALIENGIPILGVIYTPVFQDLYFASTDGSFKCCSVNPLSDFDHLLTRAKQLPLNIKKKQFTVVSSRSHMNSDTEVYIKSLTNQKGEIQTISRGSSLKLCLVAEGSADCYPRFAPTMEWDIAAGHAICRYAGASVIDYSTKNELKYNRKDLRNNWFIVTRE